MRKLLGRLYVWVRFGKITRRRSVEFLNGHEAEVEYCNAKGVWLGIGLMVTMIQDCRIEDKMSNHREITPLDRRYTESLHLVPTRGEIV